MSSMRFSRGQMAVLTTPVGNYKTAEWQQLQDRLHDTYGHRIAVNYEGTLAFSDASYKETYEDSAGALIFPGLSIPDDSLANRSFPDLCKAAGLAVKEETLRPYACLWYDGSDSPMSDLEISDFLQKNMLTG